MINILLFCNGSLGTRVARYIVDHQGLKITAAVVNDESKRSTPLVSELESIAKDVKVFNYSDSLWLDVEFQELMQASNLAVSVLFGHRIPAKVINHFGTNIFNLHPSLLPIGRGADPVAWSIIEDHKQGATIHVLTEELDQGSIVLQSEVKTDISMSSAVVYQMAIDELFNLFGKLVEHWPEHVHPTHQDGLSSYHKTKDLIKLRSQLLDGNHELEPAIRLIQALTYSDNREARVRFQDGTIWDVSLSLKRVD